jgi:hypothetical protein
VRELQSDPLHGIELDARRGGWGIDQAHIAAVVFGLALDHFATAQSLFDNPLMR